MVLSHESVVEEAFEVRLGVEDGRVVTVEAAELLVDVERGPSFRRHVQDDFCNDHTRLFRTINAWSFAAILLVQQRLKTTLIEQAIVEVLWSA